MFLLCKLRESLDKNKDIYYSIFSISLSNDVYMMQRRNFTFHFETNFTRDMQFSLRLVE